MDLRTTIPLDFKPIGSINMELLEKYKTPLIVIAAAILLFVAYRFLFGEPTATTPTLVVQGVESGAVASPEEQELLATLLELRELTLNETLFEDPLFQSLEDFSEEILPEPVGRSNPFAPLFLNPVQNPELPPEEALISETVDEESEGAFPPQPAAPPAAGGE